MAKAKPVKKAQTKSAPKAKKTSKPEKAAAKAKDSKADAKKLVKKSEAVAPKKTADSKASKSVNVAETAKEKEVKKSTGASTSAKSSTTKAKSKTKKVDKNQSDEMDDDMLSDDFGDSEIAEYEEDLKAVEEEDEEITDEMSEEEDTAARDEEVYLTDSEGRRLCRVRDCDQVANVEGYCRYHYLLLWKRIQTRKQILLDGKLEKYVDDLMARYPDKFLEVIRKDLRTEKDFMSVIQEMELDESALVEQENDDDSQSFADEIRGLGDAPSLDDDGDY